MPIFEAALEAARLRLRPILMTSFAFILGVVPLMLASGAGAASKHSVGTAVFGGMIAATVLTTLAVPAFYVLIQGLPSDSAAARRRHGRPRRRQRRSRHEARTLSPQSSAWRWPAVPSGPTTSGPTTCRRRSSSAAC